MGSLFPGTASDSEFWELFLSGHEWLPSVFGRDELH